MILKLKREIYKLSLEYQVEPESKEVLKQTNKETKPNLAWARQRGTGADQKSKATK